MNYLFQDIAQNYQAVKVQWTKQLVAKQEQKTQEILKETENLKATKDAEREKNVEEIQLQKELLQKQKEKVRILEDKVDPYAFAPF